MTRILMVILLSLMMTPFMGAAYAGKKEKAEDLVVAAQAVVRDFAGDDLHTGFLENARNAKAIVVIPTSYRGGFLFGGSGGNAALLARGNADRWSYPSFLRVGSLSFGFQAGGEVSEIILLVMTNRGKEQLLSTSVKLGADLSVAAGPTGVGGKVQTSDVLAYSKSKGLFGSVSVEGVVLKTNHKWNKAYYGMEVTPLDIIAFGKATNPHAVQLINAVTAITQRR